MIEPDGVLDKAHQTYTITWTDSDPDSSAHILLYYDLDNDGANGSLITQGAILEDDESDRYFWDTSPLPEDDYYIYAVINDGTHPPVTSVSSGPITVIHNAPPRLTFLEPDGISDTEDLSYTITWTDQDPDNDASIDLFYDTNGSGADGTPIPGAQSLFEDDETDQYVWDITGLPEEDFYVYATISDGVMDPFTVYSPGPLTVLHVSTNIPPTLSFVEPDGVGDTADQSYDITWVDEDPDNNADILLFYDDDNLGEDGLPVNLVAISEDDETDLLTWDTSSLANGDYYVYAVINDHVRPPVTVYSSGPLTVSHANAVPSLTLHEPDGVNDSADQSITLTWTDEDPDDDATISLYYDVDNTGADGVLIAGGLSEDDETDSYSWSTAGVNGEDYYNYAVIDDGSHTPLTVYSTGRVSVDHEAYGITWARQAGSPFRDRAQAVATDSAGNSYVTGYLKGDILFGSILLTQLDAREAFLVKYDPNGIALWAFNFGSQDDSFGMGVAVDASDNVYVTGYFENVMQFGGTTLTAVGSTDLFVAKYSSGGSLLWAKRFGTTGWSQALSLDVSGNGDAYLTGTFTGQIAFGGTTLSASGNSDVFVAKLNSSGQAQWARKGGSPSTGDAEVGYGIAIDGNGNAYVTGQFTQTATFDGLSVTSTNFNPEIFFVKYSSGGVIQWLRSFGGEGWDRGKAVTADGGNVYLTGWFEDDADFGGVVLSTNGRPEVFVVKCSSSTGAVLWGRRGGTTGDDRGHAISVTPDHDVVISGEFFGAAQFEGVTLDGRGGFVAQYTSGGTLEWVRPTSSGLAWSSGVASDNAGDVVVVGYFVSTVGFDRTGFTSLGDSDVYVAKIDRATVSNSPPVIDIVEPDGVGDVAAESYTISWTDDDLEDDAQILLFFDTDANGEDGMLLTPVALSEDDLSDQHVWDVSTLAPGDYYVYAQIRDNSNPVVTVYSDGPVTVDPTGGNTAPVISILEPDGVEDLASQSYVVTWSDEDPDSDAAVDLYYDVDNVAGGGMLIVSGLSENDEADSYVWDTSGVVDGEYYVYGVIDDGVAPAVVAYSTGVVTVDSTPARVNGTGSVPDTGDGQLVEGELTPVSVWQLLVTFDEGMWNPPGNVDPGDVTNPSSYRLSVDSGDGFDPAGCAGGEDPEDVQVVVSYAAASRTATLNLQGGGLADGTYRLFVCGTLLDEAGNGLDGDGNGAGGDDFARTFTVDATPPRVNSVESDPDTDDGMLTEGEATSLSLTELRVKLDEVVYDPPGDGTVDDVTNPANYLLFTDGGDGFDTVDCAAGVAPGDVESTVDAVSYDAVESTATLAINAGAPLAEGRYRLHVCGSTSILDLAGSALDGDGDGSGGDDFTRTFLVDQSMPSNPSVSSPTHVPGTWRSLATVGMEWSGASDTGGSDIAGYSVLFDLAPTTVPDTVIDVMHAVDPHATSSGALPSGGHYFHLRTCDAAGNCTAAVHLGPFLVDTSAPVAASNLTSSSHPVGVPVNEEIVEVSWSPAVDAVSGVAGYASAFDTASSWACDRSQDLAAAATAASSPALPSGIWYFHLCAVDLVGNWSEVATAGPFVVVIRHGLSITTDGDGDGGVLILPGGTSCTGTCTATFPEDTDVTLTPNPTAGSAFAGWSGDCTGTGACALTMDTDKTVTATFQVDNSPPTLDPVGSPFTVNAGQLLSFTATADDPNGDGLAFSLLNAPSGASIDPLTGVFTWTPTDAQGAQTYSLDVVVIDDDPSDPQSDSETIQIHVTRSVDLTVSKSVDPEAATPGQPVVFTVTVTNQGSGGVSGATLSDPVAVGLNGVSWTCSAVGGSCTASGAGALVDSHLNLDRDGVATYTIQATLAAGAPPTVTNVASVSVPSPIDDPNPGNDQASVSVSRRDLDFGDAPDANTGAEWSFPTRLSDDGARHGVDPTLVLGADIDGEDDGQPGAGAVGDDDAGADDEDGVVFLEAMVSCEETDLEVTTSAVGLLDAWVDFNGDGDWGGAGEQVFASRSLVAGVNALSFVVPCSAVPAERTFLRFRLSSTGGLSYTGLALDGEVEDYVQPILGYDYGDAPAGYPTLFSADGARHLLTLGGPVLGQRADAEVDGIPDPSAAGDDLTGVPDDEDGIASASLLVPGASASLTVTVSAPAKLDAWIDFNGDGDWTDPGEQIFVNEPVPSAGANLLTFAVPAGAVGGLSTVGRFRLSSAGGLSFTGAAPDGEVEDHVVVIDNGLACNVLTQTQTGNGTQPTASPSAAGCPAGQYTEGEQIQLTASPAPGWTIGSWTGTDNDASTSTSNTATMPEGPHEVTVHYVESGPTCFELVRTQTGNGTQPSASPSTAGCPAGQYAEGEQILLEAIPDSGWTVSRWTGTDNDASTLTSNTATMPEGLHEVTVHYVPLTSVVLINEVFGGSPDYVELYNAGSSTVDLAGWILETTGCGSSTVSQYVLPAFTLAPGAYVHVLENSGTGTSDTFYLNANVCWNPDEAGSAALVSTVSGIDFVRWGGSTTPPPSGTSWTGDSAVAATGDSVLGRNSSSTDTGTPTDWCEQASSAPGVNVGCTGSIFSDGFESGDRSAWTTSVP